VLEKSKSKEKKMPQKTILVIDDDQNIRELIDLYLSKEGFNIILAKDGSQGLTLAKEHSPDLIILDLMLPIIHGFDVCKMIRKTDHVPIILLTARDMVDDKVNGFENGADDYIVKPFDPRELVSRVKARLKTVAQSSLHEKSISMDNVTVNLDSYEVLVDKHPVDLKPKEIQLLYFLMVNKNHVFSRDHLLSKVWNYDFYGDTRTVDVHIKNLREKLCHTSLPFEITTIRGVGYKLEVK
jgi:two-component system OmpR family response regulator